MDDIGSLGRLKTLQTVPAMHVDTRGSYIESERMCLSFLTQNMRAWLIAARLHAARSRCSVSFRVPCPDLSLFRNCLGQAWHETEFLAVAGQGLLCLRLRFLAGLK